jgi:hypothetical protein
MRRLGALLAMLALLTAGGCQTDLEPSPAELKAQWDAQNVYPQHYKTDLLAYLRTYLNDPTRIRDAGVSQPQLKPAGPGQRFVACVRYNERKDNGQYAGAKDGAAIYVGAKLDRFIDEPKSSKELCKDAVYAPFPELEKLTR